MKYSLALFAAAMSLVVLGPSLLVTKTSAGDSVKTSADDNVKAEVSESDAVQSESVEDSILQISDAQVSLIQNAFIASPLPGVVATIDVKEGDRVTKGTRLALLDDLQAKTELLAARAAYEAARLAAENDVDERYAIRTLAVNKRELRQSEIANQNFRGTVSSTELDKLRLVVEQSALAIEQAAHERLIARATATEKQASVNIVNERLKKHGIETTVNGIVTEIDVELGEWVEAGKPIVRVISLDPIRVECFVDGLKYGRNLVGKKAEFVPSLGDAKDKEAFSGEVTHVSPELHPVTGQVRLWATIKNPNHEILAGMRGKLKIKTK